MSAIDTSAPVTTESLFPSPVSISDDEYSILSESSWMEIETSSAGPSAFGGLSDDSISGEHGLDHDSRSDVSTSSFEGSIDDREQLENNLNYNNEDDDETPSLSLIGGPRDFSSSKLDPSQMGSSVDTIHQNVNSNSSSQVQLIYPDPGFSFSASTVLPTVQSFTGPKRSRSRAETHSENDKTGSTALHRIRSSTFVKDKSGDKSCKLWAPDAPCVGEYKRLESIESIQQWSDVQTDIPKVGVEKQVDKDLKQAVGESQGRNVNRVSANGQHLTSRSSFARWSLISALLLAIIGTYGPSVYSVTKASTRITQSYLEAKASIWEHRLVSPFLASSVSEPPKKFVPVTSGSEYQLIKHALSAFSTVHIKAFSAPHAHTTAPTKRKEPVREMHGRHTHQSIVRSVSLKEESSLSIVVSSKALIPRAKKWTHNLINSKPIPRVESSLVARKLDSYNKGSKRIHDLSAYLFANLPPRFLQFYTIAKYFALTNFRTLSLALSEEFDELLAALKYVIKATQSTSSLVLLHATRGAQNLRNTLLPLLQSRYILNLASIESSIEAEANLLNRRFVNSLREVAKMFKTETSGFKETTTNSLRKAKKGLKRVIKQTKDLHSRDKMTESSGIQPRPFSERGLFGKQRLFMKANQEDTVHKRIKRSYKWKQENDRR
nr:hypothetical protein L204_01050 [Cryptococcus depauperatus CBS 7855]